VQEQQAAGKARMIGYGIGIVIVVAVVAWRFLIR
jgi:hypothetical protein